MLLDQNKTSPFADLLLKCMQSEHEGTSFVATSLFDTLFNAELEYCCKSDEISSSLFALYECLNKLQIWPLSYAAAPTDVDTMLPTFRTDVIVVPQSASVFLDFSFLLNFSLPILTHQVFVF